MVNPGADSTASTADADPFGLRAVLPASDAAQALAEADQVVAAFALIAEPIAPPAALRARLIARVQSAPVVSHGREALPGITFMLRGEGEWHDIGAPGVQLKYLHVDDTARYVRTLVRMAPGSKFPPHRHQAREETVLLEGDLHIDGQDMQPGDYCIAAAGTVHGMLSTQAGALFMAIACLDDRPVTLAELQLARAAISPSAPAG